MLARLSVAVLAVIALISLGVAVFYAYEASGAVKDARALRSDLARLAVNLSACEARADHIETDRRRDDAINQLGPDGLRDAFSPWLRP